MKRILAIAAVTVLLLSAALAGPPVVQKLLPANDAVKGFTIMAGSLTYGKGDDISKIYNGGYELYIRNGVVDAARQMYQRKDDYIEVTVHTMKSSKAAKSFFAYWQKVNKVKTVTRAKRSASFVVTKPAVTGYMAVGEYFVTVSGFYKADRASGDAKAFLAVIEKLALGK